MSGAPPSCQPCRRTSFAVRSAPASEWGTAAGALRHHSAPGGMHRTRRERAPPLLRSTGAGAATRVLRRRSPPTGVFSHRSSHTGAGAPAPPPMGTRELPQACSATTPCPDERASPSPEWHRRRCAGAPRARARLGPCDGGARPRWLPRALPRWSCSRACLRRLPHVCPGRSGGGSCPRWLPRARPGPSGSRARSSRAEHARGGSLAPVRGGTAAELSPNLARALVCSGPTGDARLCSMGHAAAAPPSIEPLPPSPRAATAKTPPLLPRRRHVPVAGRYCT
jgi:hypothetical protein